MILEGKTEAEKLSDPSNVTQQVSDSQEENDLPIPSHALNTSLGFLCVYSQKITVSLWNVHLLEEFTVGPSPDAHTSHVPDMFLNQTAPRQSHSLQRAQNTYSDLIFGLQMASQPLKLVYHPTPYPNLSQHRQWMFSWLKLLHPAKLAVHCSHPRCLSHLCDPSCLLTTSWFLDS